MPLPHLDPEHATTRLTVRVRFCDTDLMGIVHHANYLAYFEAGRVEWLRRRQVAYTEWASRGTHLPVVDASVRYRLPARFDDLLVVESRLAEVKHASLRFEYRIFRDGTLLTEGSTRLACVGNDNAVRRFEPDMVQALFSPEDASLAASPAVAV